MNLDNPILDKMKIITILFVTIGLVYCDDALQELQQGNLEFSAALYQKLIKDNTDNVIMSPLSVQLVLALTQLGAKGETALELSKGLHLPSSPEKIKEAFKALIPKLKGNQFYSLDSANKVYVKEGYKINQEFLKQSQEIFDAGLENVNFEDALKASQTINKWVESKTNEKIKDLITPDTLDELTRLVLVNAVYFKANWSAPFESYLTSKRKFFKSEKEEIEVDTMHLTESFKYAENTELDAKFVQIPYEGGDVVFTVVLPNKKEGLGDLESRLTDVLRPQNYSYERVSLFMPKFKIESSFNLVKPLQELGIKKAFDAKYADLSGLLENNEQLVISDVVQKAFINVTESGTEAAAATAVVVTRVESLDIGLLRTPIVLKIDRPFTYFIKIKEAILFVGRVLLPQQ